ncbi:MAG: hypothetical protein PWP08_1649 [Methanofollis sp.]|nr:hypothetical protein [Methanofollis sp.]
MSKDVLPMTVVLLVALLLASGLIAENGIRLQDGIYTVGTDDAGAAAILAGDPRFVVSLTDSAALARSQDAYDLVIADGAVRGNPTEKGRAALSAFAVAYRNYRNSVYTGEDDLFAAYPLWIDTVEVTSSLDFTATDNGQRIAPKPQGETDVRPSGPVEDLPTPPATLAASTEELRRDLADAPAENNGIARYLGMFSSGPDPGEFKTPSQLSPPLPFDSLIYIFVFIFPLYFTSQFAMMSIANERIERRGEILLSTPAGPLTIIAGKMLPYFLMMIAVSSAIVLITGGSFLILLPLVPVILFFLAAALLIGMTARSFRELSFLSIFFSTVMTSYLFFPSIFANVHVISLLSPLTLVVLQFQGTGFSAADYVYATALFWLSTAFIFWLCTRNFTEEQLFSQESLTSRLCSFIFAAMSREHPFASLAVINVLAIPLVFMVQMMYLVLLFNLPLPWSLVALILLAAFTEEVARSVGIVALFRGIPDFFTWRNVVVAAAATGLGFLVGEKLLLLVMMAQVTGSLFGTVLFSGVGLLWMPFLLHTAGALIVGAALKAGGRGAYFPGILLATAVHASYNLILIGGAL